MVSAFAREYLPVEKPEGGFHPTLRSVVAFFIWDRPRFAALRVSAARTQQETQSTAATFSPINTDRSAPAGRAATPPIPIPIMAKALA